MHRPHRTRRTLRRYLRTPVIRFTIGALVVAIAVGIVFAATDTATALPAYLQERHRHRAPGEARREPAMGRFFEFAPLSPDFALFSSND